MCVFWPTDHWYQWINPSGTSISSGLALWSISDCYCCLYSRGIAVNRLSHGLVNPWLRDINSIFLLLSVELFFMWKKWGFCPRWILACCTQNVLYEGIHSIKREPFSSWFVSETWKQHNSCMLHWIKNIHMHLNHLQLLFLWFNCELCSFCICN